MQKVEKNHAYPKSLLLTYLPVLVYISRLVDENDRFDSM